MESMHIDGAKIARLREARDMSQAELARRIGIKQPSLWEIENNKRKTLRSSTLQALCEVLSTTPDYLLSDAESNNGDQGDLFAMESELLSTLRRLRPELRVALLEYARYLRQQQGDRDEPKSAKNASVHKLDLSNRRSR